MKYTTQHRAGFVKSPTLQHRRSQRRGSLLVWCAFLMVVLVGMVGLVIDGGLMMARDRHAQNAADAAAMEAAYRLLRGEGSAAAISSGQTYVTSANHNNLPNATVTINIPPASGPYAGSSLHAEALVTTPSPTLFIHVLGLVNSTVSARAVAGSELVNFGDGVIALDPDARPGLKISGQAALKVNGRVVVNSEGAGVDENGDDVVVDTKQTATTVNNNGILCAADLDIVGGVNSNGLDNIENIDPNGPHPLNANQPPEPDPLLFLPTPSISNGVVDIQRGAPQASNGSLSLNNSSDGSATANFIETDPGTGEQTMVLHPGIYKSIKVTGGKVRMEPGIYVIRPPNNVSFGIEITGGDVSAEGIMFYNTGSNYQATGAPDNADNLTPDLRPPPADGAHFADVKINADIRITPLDTSLYNYGDAPASISDFDGMLFYQRRMSDSRMQIEGNADENDLGGTFYAKWGELKIDGQGTMQASFVVGSFSAEGQGEITINPETINGPQALKLFLVE